MKKFNTTSTLSTFLFLLISLASQAQGLSANIKAEESWAPGALNFPTLGNQVQGYFSTSAEDRFRLQSVSEAASGIQITGGYFQGSKNLETSRQKCQAFGTGLRTIKNYTNNVYRVSGFLYPFSQMELQLLAQKSHVQIENLPNVITITTRLLTTESSIVTPDSAKEFELKMNQELNLRLPQLKDSGFFEVDLTDADDVVCDLVLGQSHLEINFGLSYEMAKHERQTVLTAGEFAKLYEALEKTEVKAASPQTRLLIDSAVLAQKLQSELQKSLSDVGETSFIHILNQIYSNNTGLMKEISNRDIAAAAESLDVVRIYPLFVNLKVRLTPTETATSRGDLR